ncbi:MAG: transposase, partial [Gammaproteobacteria bacterium]|nr:transposase [Gammaproteobacteria bacterium]
MLPPNDTSVSEVARESKIPKDTLYTWRRRTQSGRN